MDNNTMYAATMVGRQSDHNDQIIKEVWAEEGYSGLVVPDLSGIGKLGRIATLCQPVYDSQGKVASDKCQNAAKSCKDDACNKLAEKYARALKKGYKGSFTDFKKRSAGLASIGQLGAGLIGGLLSNLGNKDQGGNQEDYYGAPKKRTGLYIGLGIAALAAVGVAIYFARKNN